MTTTTDPNRRMRTAYVLGDVVIERRQQQGPGDLDLDVQRAMLTTLVENLTDDPTALRVELVRIAAVAVAGVEALDERTAVTR